MTRLPPLSRTTLLPPPPPPPPPLLGLEMSSKVDFRPILIRGGSSGPPSVPRRRLCSPGEPRDWRTFRGSVRSANSHPRRYLNALRVVLGPRRHNDYFNTGFLSRRAETHLATRPAVNEWSGKTGRLKMRQRMCRLLRRFHVFTYVLAHCCFFSPSMCFWSRPRPTGGGLAGVVRSPPPILPPPFFA